MFNSNLFFVPMHNLVGHIANFIYVLHKLSLIYLVKPFRDISRTCPYVCILHMVYERHLYLILIAIFLRKLLAVYVPIESLSFFFLFPIMVNTIPKFSRHGIPNVLAAVINGGIQIVICRLFDQSNHSSTLEETKISKHHKINCVFTVSIYILVIGI